MFTRPALPCGAQVHRLRRFLLLILVVHKIGLDIKTLSRRGSDVLVRWWNERGVQAFTAKGLGSNGEKIVTTEPHEQARERLLAAIDTIDADVAAVAMWACALSAFAQPVLTYGPDDLHPEYVRAELK